MDALLIIITISIIAFFISCLILYALKIRIWIFKLRNKKLRIKNAKLVLELLKNNYELHLLLRRKYYETRFIDDPVIKKKKMDEYRKQYIDCISYFSDPEIFVYKQYLSEEEQKEFDEILKKPIYKLM